MIVIAACGGLLLDTGLFLESFGEYLLENGDDDKACTRKNFGAKRKVAQIEKKHNSLWSKPEYVVAANENLS